MTPTRRRFLVAAAGCAATTLVSASLPGTVSMPVTWESFRSLFLDTSGRIIDTGNGGISHSEGQGYGLILALRADDRSAFDSMFAWTRENLLDAEFGLHAWRYDPRLPDPIVDPNNATDGDLLIAWALQEAAARWSQPEFAEAAARIRSAMLAHCTIEVAGAKLLLPGRQGFVGDETVTLNPSYYVWPALDAFHAAVPEEQWDRIAIDGAAFITKARFGPANLPTDWVGMSPLGEVVPAEGRDPRFGFDAVRVALYSAAGGRSGLARPIGEYWQRLLDSDQPIPAWIDVKSGEIAPYPMSEGGLAVASLMTSARERTSLSADYYSAVLQMLCRYLPNPADE